MKNWFPLLLLAAMWLLVLIVFMTPAAPDSTGFAHPQHAALAGPDDAPAMNQGGDGKQRHGHMLAAGGLFAGVTVVFLVGMLMLGTQAAAGAGKIAVFAIGGVGYAAVFLMLFLAYGRSLQTGEVAFIGPFPAATWWLLFGVYFIPYYFIVVYVVFYGRWITTPESLQTFARLADQRRADPAQDD